ncbi:Globin-coupled histidine kinase [Allorhodopirellula heiligendammensis]|uniref:histidine kinase n=2 Tax=Allorhodopirellula heiligendammensis TaxID=2714739 RepID=A0A5C6C6B7_9BACT|nr:Globin-coupled histidine kinase [Allorhodopirellula heiligendammensis]
MVAAALLAAAIVAVASYGLGARWATEELQSRFEAIEQSLSGSSFPLHERVLDSLAELTQTELVSVNAAGAVIHSTIDLDDGAQGRFESSEDGRTFHTLSFPVRNEVTRQDRVAGISVLFDKSQIEASRRRAAILPLATGLSTILALTTIMLLLSSRLINRVGKLQQRVELVAGGDFQSTVSDDIDDEIGRLGGAVDSMASQLSRLWSQINRQQSEKLLHQIAGGMAHQLRNSLTGARMAVEMHAQQCPAAEDEGIAVAIAQMEVAEDYVRRLLLVASGRQDEDRPAEVQSCFEDVRSSVSPIARHLHVSMRWMVNGLPAVDVSHSQGGVGGEILDGPTWIAAASNLIHNAIQAGNDVHVELRAIRNDCVRLSVSDDGPGVPESIAADVFEPFVTSKPEGMGLGLSVVRRAAERLGGDVRWRREIDRTCFELDAQLR